MTDSQGWKRTRRSSGPEVCNQAIHGENPGNLWMWLGKIITFLFSLTSNWNLLFFLFQMWATNHRNITCTCNFWHSRNQRCLHITLQCCRLFQDIYAHHFFEIMVVIRSTARHSYLMCYYRKYIYYYVTYLKLVWALYFM